MIISDRDVSKQELDDIYADFTKIDAQDGIPEHKQIRYQYVAEENGIIIGYASGLTNHTLFYLSDLWVHEDYRCQGLGAKLLGMLEHKVKSLGIKHMHTWTTGAANTMFYEKQGYTAFTVFHNYTGINGYHKIGFRKEL